MDPDPGLERTRNIRQQISRELGNDPRRLVEYDMEYQRRFGSRLRRAPGSDQVGDEATAQADAAERPSVGH